MEHVVFFPASDGTPAFRRVGGLEEAVALVEHLRNVEGVPEVSVHTLSEVPLQFRPWYRVELPPTAAGQHAAADAAPVHEVPPVPVPQAAAAPAPVEAAAQPVAEVPAVEVPAVEPPADAAGSAPEPAQDEPLAADAGQEPSGEAADGRPSDSAKSLGFFA